jgi:phosphate starvation-inducible PhoH-like protein
MAKKAIRKPDTSPYIYQQKKVPLTFSISEKIPWTEKQLDFFKIVNDKNTKLVFLSGCAGTGKTIMAMYAGLNSILEKRTSSLIYTRVPVESSAYKIGYLPGDVDSKLLMYFSPMLEKLEELVNPETKTALLANGFVTGKAINFMRGEHLAVKFVIADESQCFDFPSMQLFLTRIGEKSKVIMCGDPMQSDIGEGKSAFVKFMNAFDTEEARSHGIHVFKLGKEDIVRSELLKYIVEVIEKM